MLMRAAVLLGALTLAGCTPPLDPEDKARLDEAFATGFDLDVLRYDWDEGRAEQTEQGLGEVLGQLTTVPFQLSPGVSDQRPGARRHRARAEGPQSP